MGGARPEGFWKPFGSTHQFKVDKALVVNHRDFDECHSEERSDEESHPLSEILRSAQNDITHLHCG